MLNFKNITILTVLLVSIALLLNYFYPISPLIGVFLFICWIVITLLGSAIISWNYFFESLHSNMTINENQIAITFDDGPNPEFTPQVLSLLKQYNAKATFFCIGKHIEAYPDIFKNIISEGHTVGNHTYSHANSFGFFSTKRITEELQKTNAIVKEVSDLELKLYRPAFGITNPNIKKAISTTQLTSIGWSKRSFDTTKLSEETIYKRVTNKLEKGDIILLHDSSTKTVHVLEQLLLFLQANQLQSVTVDQLLDIKAYA